MQESVTDPCIVVNFTDEGMLCRCMHLRETTLRVQQPQQGAGGLPFTATFKAWLLDTVLENCGYPTKQDHRKRPSERDTTGNGE